MRAFGWVAGQGRQALWQPPLSWPMAVVLCIHMLGRVDEVVRPPDSVKAAGSHGQDRWRILPSLAYRTVLFDGDIPCIRRYQKNWRGSGEGLTVLVSWFVRIHAKVPIALGFPLNPYTTCY